MTETDKIERLKLELELQSTDKCIEVALRSALRNFTPPNFSGTLDASERYVFPFGRLLLQAIVHSRFQCVASQRALNRTIAYLQAQYHLFSRSSAYLAAIATLNRDRAKAVETIESVITSFASNADQEQFQFAQTPKDFSTRHAYEALRSVVSIASLNDLDNLDGNAFDKPLWIDKVAFKVPLEKRNNFSEYFKGESFAFWREWHQGFLEGKPLDWELQRQVALINESVWSAGPEAVTNEIKQIRARWRVKTGLADLNEGMRLQTTARHGIGGNYPPDRIEDEHLSGCVALIFEATEELSTALEQEKPKRAWVEKILEKIKTGLASLLNWCASKGNLAVDTAIKWGIPATGAGYVAKHSEKIETLIEAIERWLPFLS